MFPALKLLIKQVFQKPFTNKFPVKYAPKNVTALLQKVQKGEASINPPIPQSQAFRGKIVYDRDACIGCKMCIRVCPAKCIEFKEEEKKIKIYAAQCISCAQCVEICPVDCLKAGNEFLLAHTDRLDPSLIVE